MISERKETLMRIFVAIISGIILGVWYWLVKVFTILNFFITLFSGKRHKELSRLCELWNTNTYFYIKYLTFGTNKRPFPFTKLNNPMTKFEK